MRCGYGDTMKEDSGARSTETTGPDPTLSEGRAAGPPAMVARVQDAILAANKIEGLPFSRLIEEFARAAIGAMREATPEMWGAGNTALHVKGQELGHAWRAMIDAALCERTEGPTVAERTGERGTLDAAGKNLNNINVQAKG